MSLNVYSRAVSKITPLTQVRNELLDGYYDKTVVEMFTRRSEFQNVEAAVLAAVMASPDIYRRVDEAIDALWSKNRRSLSEVASDSYERPLPEVIIGSGVHAAIYANVRVASGRPKPLVLEAGERAGGMFGMTHKPTFYLNSRNRPGRLSIPGEDGALNVIPGAPVQPADLSADEYQPNTALGWPVRTSLVKNASVITSATVAYIRQGYSADNEAYVPKVTLTDGTEILAERVVIATGIGTPRRFTTTANDTPDNVLDYIQFMRRMESRFPLRDLGRIAVIGAGDGGRTVIEALVGQGPQMGMSVAALDWPERIDWYGVPTEQTFRSEWRENNRSRYDGIGRVLPRSSGDRQARVFPTFERVDRIQGTYDGVRVNGKPYDTVVDARGYDQNPLLEETNGYYGDYGMINVEGRSIARKAFDKVAIIGPAAEIPSDSAEISALPSRIPENSVALFRYADRTAKLASTDWV